MWMQEEKDLSAISAGINAPERRGDEGFKHVHQGCSRKDKSAPAGGARSASSGSHACWWRGGCERRSKQSHGAAAKLRAEAFTLLMAALFPAAVCCFPFPGQRWLWGKPLQSQHSHPFSHLKTQKSVAHLNRLINTKECSELHYVCFTLKPSTCARSTENDEAI